MLISRTIWILFTFFLFLPSNVLATLLGIQGSTNRQLISINTSTGAITPIGSTFSIHSANSGVDALDPTNNRFFTVVQTSAGADYQLYILNSLTGAVSGSPTLTGTNASPIRALKYNTTNGVLYGIQGSTNRQLISINTSTGAITPIGSTFSIHSANSGVDALDPTNNRFFTVVQTSAGADYQLQILNTLTGAVSGSPTLTGTNASPIRALKYNTTNGVLYGIQGSTNRQLISINTSTGAITPIGSTFSIHSANSGVDALDPTNNRFFTVVQTSAGADYQLQILNTLTGAVSGSPTLTGTNASPIRALKFDAPPIANNDTTVLNEDSSANIAVLSNDTDPAGSPLTLVSASSANNGTAITNSDNTITYSPNSNFNGTDQFTYTIRDPFGNTASATVNITINPVNDTPVATTDSQTLNEDHSATISVLNNDTDIDGDTLTLTSVSNASNGSVTSNNDNTVTYTPNSNFNGTDLFTYTINDGNGATATGTVNLTITSVEDPPIAVADTAALLEDNSITISVLTNDSDPDGNTLSISSVVTSSNGSAITNSNNTITYTPAKNFNGTDQFTYTINDGNGNTATTTTHLTINSVEDVPIAIDDLVTLDEDQPITFDVLKNDSDPDGDTVAISSITNPTNGSTTLNNKSITYWPKSDFNGTDIFTYIIHDGKGNTDTASVNLTITSINDAPFAIEDRVTIQQDHQIVISVLDNDQDKEGDEISLNAISQPSNGSANIQDNMQISYSPNQGFFGSDVFTYTIIDRWQASATGTVQITVLKDNLSPTAVDDEVHIRQGDKVNIPVLINDHDTDGDSIWVAEYTNGSHSERVVQNSDGTIFYQPLPEFHGLDQFTYTIVDIFGKSDQANVQVWVASHLRTQPDTVMTDEDVAITISVLDNDSGNDSLNIISLGSAVNGNVQLQNDATITYSSRPNFNGIDSFSYTVSDLQDTSTALVTVIVNPINDAPIAVNDTITTRQGVAVSIDVLDNDLDIDGDLLEISEFSTGLHGTVSLNIDGTVSYLPNENFTGEDSFTYRVVDGQGGTTTGQIVVIVLGLGEGTIGPMALDLNLEIGDQSQRDTTLTPDIENQIIIDIVAVSGIRDNIGFQAVLRYDANMLSFIGFEGIDLMAEGVAIPPTLSGSIIEINVALLGQTVIRDSGSLGRVTFDVLNGFSGQTKIELIGAQYNEPLLIGPGGSTIVITKTSPSFSPDFNSNGSVDFQDFILFAGAFGSQTGDTRYDTRLDLDVSGDIGFPDFIQFAQAFGQTAVQKKPK